MARPRRRYAADRPDLDRLIEELVESAAREYGHADGSESVRQIVVTALRLLRDGADESDVRLLSSALKELRHSFRVFAPYEQQRKVAVFGSARTQPGTPEWRQAFSFAERITEQGWMVITGAGGGIMAAAQGGAGREASFGVNIRLPFEQRANEVIAGDSKLVNFRYFFTRKVVFVKEAHGIALFPGGFGTHDEGFEALTLIQTGKINQFPVILFGRHYWAGLVRWLSARALGERKISPGDMDLMLLIDDPREAADAVIAAFEAHRKPAF
jgi:uncharacterized protein (TIGR00730 family)